MDIEKFYQMAHAGEKCNQEELFEYINSYANVILWGAGNLGTILGKFLLVHHVKINSYWDKRFEECGTCNGLQVTEPFSLRDGLKKDETLVIGCIVNGSLGEQWSENAVIKSGFTHYLHGMALYEAIICPLSQEYFNIKECTSRKACSLCNCKKYTNLVDENVNKQDSLTFQLITFIISTRCTLNCKYCGQRLTNYQEEDRKDFALENIKRDIDNFMGAVDFVGMISLIGGEPFVHKDLAEIVQYCLTKNNFGVVNITTNGICKMTKEMLQTIKNDRVKISFSCYDKFLNEKQKNLLKDNIALVEQSGISYSISNPLWNKPQELINYEYEEVYMKERKQYCENIKMCAAVKDGIFYPCSIAENIAGVTDYGLGNSVVDVTDKTYLTDKLNQCLNASYFDVCKYCGNKVMEEIPAGEQVE